MKKFLKKNEVLFGQKFYFSNSVNCIAIFFLHFFNFFSFQCIFKDTPCFCVGRGRQSPFLVCCIASIHSKGSFRKLLPTKAPSMKATLAFFSISCVAPACHCLILPQSRSSLWSSAAASLTKSIDLLSVVTLSHLSQKPHLGEIGFKC